MRSLETVLITGATGFVGRALVSRLAVAGWKVRALMRTGLPQDLGSGQVTWHRIAGLGDDDLPLSDCQAVVHLAARVHVMQERANDPLAEFRRVNVTETEQLARHAAAAGVRRFIYLSSIKVNGEETPPGRPFLAEDEAGPEDAYGISKHEAEIVLRRVAAETEMEVVIIRPPLIYGPGVKGNFRTMLGWLERGIPLPLASLDNRRSLVGLDNLCDLILSCLRNPAAANETFLVSDGQDISTAELLRLAGEAMRRPVRLFPMPPAWLENAAALIGKPRLARRICGNLQVDIGKTKGLLGWSPSVKVETGLRQIFDADDKR